MNSIQITSDDMEKAAQELEELLEKSDAIDEEIKGVISSLSSAWTGEVQTPNTMIDKRRQSIEEYIKEIRKTADMYRASTDTFVESISK